MLLFLLEQLFSLSNFLTLLKATPESVSSLPLTPYDAQSGYASNEYPRMVQATILSYATQASNGKFCLCPQSTRAMLGMGTALSVSLHCLLVSTMAATGCSEHTIEWNGTYCPL